jgi:hypothetical protein
MLRRSLYFLGASAIGAAAIWLMSLLSPEALSQDGPWIGGAAFIGIALVSFAYGRSWQGTGKDRRRDD